MKLSGRALAVIVLGLGAGWLFRSLFPKTEHVISPPRIVTVYDTVAQIDTLWRTRWREIVRWDTLPPEVVTVTSKPETVYVAPPLVGLSVLSVPQTLGDSTMAEGFTVSPADSGYVRSGWRLQWWTPGPLRALDATMFPPKPAFWPAPKVRPDCRFFCKVKLAGLGAAVGIAARSLLR